MVTHSSILAWEIPWTEEPDQLQSMGSQRVGHNLTTKQQQQKTWSQVQKDYQKDTICCAVLSQSVLSDSVSPWTVASQAPLSMGFSRQEYWRVRTQVSHIAGRDSLSSEPPGKPEQQYAEGIWGGDIGGRLFIRLLYLLSQNSISRSILSYDHFDNIQRLKANRFVRLPHILKTLNKHQHSIYLAA